MVVFLNKYKDKKQIIQRAGSGPCYGSNLREDKNGAGCKYEKLILVFWIHGSFDLDPDVQNRSESKQLDIRIRAFSKL